jgi:hypothetical protein
MIDRIAGAILNKSMAEAVGVPATTLQNEWQYVHVSLVGGLPRWYFDLLLNPRNLTTDFVAGGFGNSIDVVSGVARSVNRYINHVAGSRTYAVPPVWGLGFNGRQFGDLLNNSALVRGMDNQINSHEFANAMQVAPIINGLSISGLVADVSRRPIPGLTTGAPSGSAFKSRKALAPVVFPGGTNPLTNPLTSLLRPFQSYPAEAVFQRSDWKSVREQTQFAFDHFALTSGVTPTTLRIAYDNASEMIEQQVIRIADGWVATVAKYKAPMIHAFQMDNVTTFFPQAIRGDGGLQCAIGLNGLRTSDADLRQAFTGVGGVPVNIPGMAEQFAASELLLGNNITSSVSLAMGSMTGLKVNGISYSQPNDQHVVGRIPSTVFTSVYYRALLGCLSEFVNTLKSQGRFAKTVIHIASEFNRCPRIDGSGSDHGVAGSNATILSGAIDRMSLIGNIIKAGQPGSTTYTGTWGYAANFHLSGASRPIQVNDVAATLAAMMEVSSEGLVTNGRLLLDPQTGLPISEVANNV